MPTIGLQIRHYERQPAPSGVGYQEIIEFVAGESLYRYSTNVDGALYSILEQRQGEEWRRLLPSLSGEEAVESIIAIRAGLDWKAVQLVAFARFWEIGRQTGYAQGQADLIREQHQEERPIPF